ncbi:MAG: hypothetical protein JWN11_1457 [Hyphomicrobiales bacterium]|nr:hypothetical protein [Hyphomicrobiales bacterium]
MNSTSKNVLPLIWLKAALGRRRHHFRPWLLHRLPLVLAVSFGVYVAGIMLSTLILAAPNEIARADVMIVLGGDGPTRAAYATQLWLSGAASHVIVTGTGDCAFIAATMVAGGVDPARILLECQSRNTWQNAEFSAPLLSRLKAHSALIVTSWFHSRRALLTFESVCPSVSFTVAPVAPPSSFWQIATGPYGLAIAEEYVKAAIYAVQRFAGAIAPLGFPGTSKPRCAAEETAS